MNEEHTIYGTNNKKALIERNYPPCHIQVKKGAKKQPKRFGGDLQDRFRIEVKDEFVRKIIKQSYEAEEIEGSLFVKELNIILYCNDPYKTFFSGLAIYKNNSPIHYCNKKKIHTKFVGRRGRPVEWDEPCKSKSIYDDCPLGCKEFGIFYFEILEIQLLGLTRFCSLNVSGIRDIVGIPKALNSTLTDFKALRSSQFYCDATKRFIVHKLSRYPRKNRFNKTNFPCLLEIHPIWKHSYDLEEKKKELQRLNQPVPQKLLQSIYGEELIDGAVLTVPSQPVLEPWKPSREEIALCQELWRSHGWTKEELLKVLKSEFGLNEIREIQLFNKEQFEKFKNILEKKDANSL